ncbi:MerR family transcriptional regulator [Clostridium sp. YIM B02555]|uniref:MerR family transcriptional regulator n=1 Tax=Clostridium sp. YIM B02555 TaxID=2911968 RepID=UPI001EECF46D|nr:MerR family transcriptional regulator [Clostridium sp. YIM B02555]
MRTVKQVSDLTGISVRALHYYDQIGLLKPSEITETGYRLYDDEALKTLQQILFFRELDMPLKEVKDIMSSPYFDKMKALKNQKKLLMLKRKRLNGLIELINKTLKGEGTMNFKEFDMSEYYSVLEEFKIEHEDKVIQNYGSIDKYNEFIEKCKSKEEEIAKVAIKQYGSIEKYAKAVKNNLTNSAVLSLAEQYDKFKKDCLEDKHPKLKELFKRLTADLGKDTSSKEIQEIAEEIVNTVKEDYEVFKSDRGDDYWYYMVKTYSILPEWIEAVDKKYGSGACKFIGEALKKSPATKLPKIEALYERLTADLSKNPSSKEIQEIVHEIANETKKQNQDLKIDSGKNYIEHIAERYLSNDTYIKVTDKKYGDGASKFIGEALKFYAENNKS